MRIYDIGANKGEFTERNLHIHNTDCEYILVEANPSLAKFLEDKFKNNTNVKILNNCISNVDNEDIDFYISSEDTLSTASIKWIEKSRFKDYKYNIPIKVKSITIDSLIKKYGKSDFTKIDVEGYESVAIQGIKENIGLLAFEWAEESKEMILESIRYLKSKNYSNFHISYMDEYTFRPDNFEDYDTIIANINDNLDINRQIKWGMIFTK
jgi:FkbM family methyltransferase